MPIKIIRSNLFNDYPEVKFGFSTKVGLNRKPPYHFNMSLSVDDEPSKVRENRELFFNELGLLSSQIVFQRQVHGSTVTIVDEPGLIEESDAMITTEPGLGLAISTADCTPIFIYDRLNKIIAGIHSGWKSTKERIVEKTLVKLYERFSAHPEDLIVYIGPAISKKNYEVGKEFDRFFPFKYLESKEDKYLLDLKEANRDMLIDFGVPLSNIEVSGLCTYDEKYLHSYRREGEKSGRALGVIALAN